MDFTEPARSTTLSANFVVLKGGTKIEPLVCKWPAWPHLIAPACYAMNAAYRHLPMLRSFAAAPSVHIAATTDPALFGGPFVALREANVPAVLELIREINVRCARLLSFAREFREFDEHLQANARGFALDEFYRTMPRHLSGIAEIVYDLNNHPRIRIVEELMYEGEIDNRDVQEICLHATPDSERDFFMSTPLLKSPGRLFLNLPFDDPRIDEIVAMRQHPTAAEHARELLTDQGSGAAPPALLVNELPPRRVTRYDGSAVRVRYFGHACVLLQTQRTSILLDPVTAWERSAPLAQFTFDDLPDHIDQMIVTHSHLDHFAPEFLLQLRQRVRQTIVPACDRGNLADPSMRLILKRLGYSNIASVAAFERIPNTEGEIVSLPFVGEHAGLDIASKHCVAVRILGRQFVFLVDSDGIDANLYRQTARRIGPVDALFLGMECNGAPLTWMYGPLLTRPPARRDDESRRLSGANCERAWNMARAFDCKRVFVYAMGQEPWLKRLMGLQYTPESVQIAESEEFLRRCRSENLPAERLYGCREFFFDLTTCSEQHLSPPPTLRCPLTAPQ